MTKERAKEVVAEVKARHKNFKPKNVYSFGTYAAVTFEPIDIDPRTITKWFAEVSTPFNVGRDVLNSEMYMYFREGAK